MKLSTKGRYGLRAVLDIAINSKEDVVPLSEIALRQDISISYLEQLMSKLKKAGVVSSIRGAQGGYKLGKDPDKLSVGEILRALEGSLDPVDCVVITGEGDSCNSSDNCVTKHVWMRISNSINNAVDTLMLSELIEKNDEINLNFDNTHDSEQVDKSDKINCSS